MAAQISNERISSRRDHPANRSGLRITCLSDFSAAAAPVGDDRVVSPGHSPRPACSTSYPERERQILSSGSLQAANKEIGQTIVSGREDTVKHYMTNILQKRGCATGWSKVALLAQKGMDGAQDPAKQPGTAIAASVAVPS